jgi:hypothetical protein
MGGSVGTTAGAGGGTLAHEASTISNSAEFVRRTITVQAISMRRRVA